MEYWDFTVSMCKVRKARCKQNGWKWLVAKTEEKNMRDEKSMKMSPFRTKSFQNAITENSLSVKGSFSYSNSWSICSPEHVGINSTEIPCIMWKKPAHFL